MSVSELLLPALGLHQDTCTQEVGPREPHKVYQGHMQGASPELGQPSLLTQAGGWTDGAAPHSEGFGCAGEWEAGWDPAKSLSREGCGPVGVSPREGNQDI